MGRYRLPAEIDDRNHRRWVLRNFPAIRGLAYLASAGIAPMPRVSELAMRKFVTDKLGDVRGRMDEEELLREFKGAASRLVGSRVNEIAFTTSTTSGINLFAESIRWRRGDRILLANVEYPSNIIPWIGAARRHGARVTKLDARDGIISYDDIEKLVDDRTRVFPLSAVQFASGQRMDIRRISEVCDRHGTLLFLDAIQALGATRLDVRRGSVAGLSAGGYKWLCGPSGSGLLYISGAVADDLSPCAASWLSLEKACAKESWRRIVLGGDLVEQELAVRCGASALQLSLECSVQLLGLTTSIRFLTALGIVSIERRIRNLNRYLMDELDKLGFEVMTPREESDMAGIVTFFARRRISSIREARDISKELGEVRMAIRTGGFRSAAHLFNTKRDIDRALSAIVSCCRRRGISPA